jgi:hypothetical protein
MRKGIVGNKRKAEMNVVKVKPQSRKKCEVNSCEPGAEDESAAMGCLFGIVLRDSGFVIRGSNGQQRREASVLLTLVFLVDGDEYDAEDHL